MGKNNNKKKNFLKNLNLAQINLTVEKISFPEKIREPLLSGGHYF